MNPECPATPAAPVTVEAAGLRWRLHWGGRAPGEAPGVLLLHGTASSGASWDGCMRALAGQACLLAPDLPGHGGTSAFRDREASLPRMAHAVATLLRQLRWAPQRVAGHSAGAAVMVQLALDGALPRAEGLLAINGALEPLPGLMGAVAPALARWAAGSQRVAHWVTRHATQPGALQHLIASTGSRLGDDGVAHYRQLLAHPGHVQGVLDMLASWRLDALQARLHELRLPLTLAAGLADRTVAPVQSLELARRLPNARFVPLPGLGHLAHEEAPAVVSALLWAPPEGGKAS